MDRNANCYHLRKGCQYILFANLGLRLNERLETRFYVLDANTDSELPGTLTKAWLEADPRSANPANVTGNQKRDFDYFGELHGKTFTESVTQVTWTDGPLAEANYDEFVMLTRLPDAPGKVYFKIVQTCEQGETRWEEIPAEGTTTRDYKSPAALLEVTPSPDHHH